MTIENILHWVLVNKTELTGSVLGIIYVLLASRQNVWCWLSGIISCGLYIVVFLGQKLYGDMLLQVFYLLVGFYGWYIWLKRTDKKTGTSISRMRLTLILWCLLAIGIMTFAFGFLLTFTDDPIPYWDGFTNALGLTGTWMTARKYIENWGLWIFTNLVCVGIYFYKGLYPTVVFYFIMAVLAYRAYLIWNRELKKMHHV